MSGKGEVVIEKSTKTVSKFKPEIKVCETLTPNKTNTQKKIKENDESQSISSDEDIGAITKRNSSRQIDGQVQMQKSN